jgi:cysteinyl-tRNA synthetase
VTIRLHNTLSGKPEPVTPDDDGELGLYVCGLTVYDYAHVGNIRSALTYDILVRHLRERGIRVRYVRNVTDVEDKIAKRAKERGQTPEEVARFYEAAYREDTQRLSLLVPDAEPRVSENLDAIRALIARLIERGAAYAADGDVYFSVQAFPAYGKLSHRKQADLEYGASGRLDDDEVKRKRHPADLALWKSSRAGEPAWESPWGMGRPGWHIECSAMSMQELGESFALHGGGLDLVFPHHENENAQAEAVTGKPLARLWVHNGFIEVNREKMSKSVGNLMNGRDCFRINEPEALRYLMLTAHYRAPLGIDWSMGADGQIDRCPQLDDAERRVEYIYRTRQRLSAIPAARIGDAGEIPAPLTTFTSDLLHALDDDLNMPVALAVAAELLKQVNDLAERAKTKKGQLPRRAVELSHEAFAALGRVLGLGLDDPAAVLARIRARRAARLGQREDDVERKIVGRKRA